MAITQPRYRTPKTRNPQIAGSHFNSNTEPPKEASSARKKSRKIIPLQFHSAGHPRALAKSDASSLEEADIAQGQDGDEAQEDDVGQHNGDAGKPAIQNASQGITSGQSAATNYFTVVCLLLLKSENAHAFTVHTAPRYKHGNSND